MYELFTTIKIIEPFNEEHFFDYHKRDLMMIAEQVEGRSLKKAFILNGAPACLVISINESTVDACLVLDKRLNNYLLQDLDLLVKKFLGLDQNIIEFEDEYIKHEKIGKHIIANSGLRILTTITPFEALSRSIFSQQISLNVALNMRRNFIKSFGIDHSLGLICYPEAKNIIDIDSIELKENIGCSMAKANTLHALGLLINSGKLNIDNPSCLVELRNQLLLIKGIGPWTVDNFLMKAYGFANSSMHNDLGIRTILQKLIKSNEKLTPSFTEKWLNQFHPYKSLVAEHIWKANS